MNVGEKIRQYRTAKGLTQKELGRLSETAETTVRQYEGGKRTPRIEQVEKIAAVLNVKPSDLMGWDYWEATHPETMRKLNEDEAFEIYLSKIGYSTNYEGRSGKPQMEEQVDVSGEVAGYSQFDDDESLDSVTIIKGKKIAVFNSTEFDELQSKYLELQKKIAELEADYSDIIEMRIQKKAEAQRKSRPSRQG